MPRLGYLLPILIFVVLLVVFTVRLVAVREGDTPNLLPSVLIDRPVPTFALEPLPGRERPLSSEHLKGAVSLVNIFGSWCVACAAEHPMLTRIQQSGEVPIHGIDWRDDPLKGAAWLKRNGDPYDRVGLDPDSAVAIDFGVTGAPETFVVDAKGIIRYKHIGPITEADWTRTLLPLIKELRK
ncbi:MAG: DsbE family thiol:disulfide interchange protein [Alphaproteobacteria bacterium]|nr:DsbE family thiol:disulfide interchange protein [Alphaproteobacteria bacterium]MBF0129239.1 DsbE family thiol:disulfide interchange protein [Alphaproteobacteria bacterium]